MQGERQLDLATLTLSGQGRVKRPNKADAALFAETDEIADFEPLGRAGEGAPATLVDALMQVELDLRFGIAADACALERRRNDTCVVEDEHIAGPQQLGQLRDGAICDFGLTIRLHHEQARSITLRQRVKRYPVLGQLEIEEVGSQWNVPDSH